MIEHRIAKLENPERLRELNPLGTLKKAGLKPGYVVCDIGAGSGVFSLPAASLTEREVFAVDVNKELLDALCERAEAEGIDNIIALHADVVHARIPDSTVDLALLVTVVHELEEIGTTIHALRKMLKANGKVLVVEFWDRETPMGPPLDHRISQNEVIELFDSGGFALSKSFTLGSNLYALVFKAPQKEKMPARAKIDEYLLSLRRSGAGACPVACQESTNQH